MKSIKELANELIRLGHKCVVLESRVKTVNRMQIDSTLQGDLSSENDANSLWSNDPRVLWVTCCVRLQNGARRDRGEFVLFSLLLRQSVFIYVISYNLFSFYG